MRVLLPFLTVAILLISGCTNVFQSQTPVANSISIGFNTEGVPLLGNEFELTITYSGVTADNVSFEIYVPEEFEIIDGDTSYIGEINDRTIRKIKLKALETGDFVISSYACQDKEISGSDIHCELFGFSNLYVKVGTEDGQFSTERPLGSSIPDIENRIMNEMK